MATVKFHKATRYGDGNLVFKGISPDEAENAITSHSKGNGGSVIFTRRGKDGGNISVRVGEWNAVEVDPPSTGQASLIVAAAFALLVFLAFVLARTFG